MQVIGAGFGRTGTYSLRAALEHLGFGPCLHGFDLPGHPEAIRAWIKAAECPDSVDWDALVGGYRAMVDWPGAAFWRELVEHYSDSKVVFSVRDENEWYDSASRTVFRYHLALPARLRKLGARFTLATYEWLPPYPAMFEAAIVQRVFGGDLERENAIAVYQRHVVEVCDTVPADRLLLWRPAMGWEPLCDFLGAPVPDEPFPRLNDADNFLRTARMWPYYKAQARWRALRAVPK